MGSGEDVFVGRSEQEDEQGLRTVARELGGVHLRGDDKAHGETIGPLMRLFRRFLTASVINIDPVVSGKHIGASQPIEADWQHPYEKTASACSVYRFNNYEHRCRTGAKTRFAP